MNITLTGATGFIGHRLVERLLSDNHSLHILGRKPVSSPAHEISFSAWDALRQELPEAGIAEAEAIIHLAGEPVSQRWTTAAKHRIRASRVDGTRRLVQALSKLVSPPAVMICASAVGIYGSRGDEVLDENSAPGSGFLAETCIEWEAAARQAEAAGVRVVNIRIGVVFGRNGGLLARILPIYRTGIGGRLGSGRQWMSWIHVDDLVQLVRFALGQPAIRGPVNATAPEPLSNAEFSQTLAETLHRPSILPVPALALRALMGEMSSIALYSQRVVPKAALAAGFRFEYPESAAALRQLLY